MARYDPTLPFDLTKALQAALEMGGLKPLKARGERDIADPSVIRIEFDMQVGKEVKTYRYNYRDYHVRLPLDPSVAMNFIYRVHDDIRAAKSAYLFVVVKSDYPYVDIVEKELDEPLDGDQEPDSLSMDKPWSRPIVRWQIKSPWHLSEARYVAFMEMEATQIKSVLIGQGYVNKSVQETPAYKKLCEASKLNAVRLGLGMIAEKLTEKDLLVGSHYYKNNILELYGLKNREGK